MEMNIEGCVKFLNGKSFSKAMQQYYYKPKRWSSTERIFKIEMNEMAIDSLKDDFDYGDLNNVLDGRSINSKYARELIEKEFLNKGQIVNPREIHWKFKSEAWDIFYMSLYQLGVFKVEEVNSNEGEVEIEPSNHDTQHTYQRIVKAFAVRQRHRNTNEKLIANSLCDLV